MIDLTLIFLLYYTDNMPIGQKLKLIAKVCKHHLAPLLSNKAPDITSPPPPSSHMSGGGSQEGVFTRPTQPGVPGGLTPSSSSGGLFSPPPQREENTNSNKGKSIGLTVFFKLTCCVTASYVACEVEVIW